MTKGAIFSEGGMCGQGGHVLGGEACMALVGFKTRT